MKRLMIALMCSMGVGLALMAAPAPVGDENEPGNSANSQTTQSVTAQPEASMKQVPNRVKYAWKVKAMNRLNVIGTKLQGNNGLTPQVRDLETKRRGGHPLPDPRIIIRLRPNPIYSVESLGGGSGSSDDFDKIFNRPTE